MSTFRSIVQARLARLHRMKKHAKFWLALSLVYFLILTVIAMFVDLSSLDSTPWVALLLCPVLVLIVAWHVSARASRLLHQAEPCPQCGKDLSYLLTDPSYSRCGGWRIPLDFPVDISACPYCSRSFEENETAEQSGGEVRV